MNCLPPIEYIGVSNEALTQGCPHPGLLPHAEKGEMRSNDEIVNQNNRNSNRTIKGTYFRHGEFVRFWADVRGAARPARGHSIPFGDRFHENPDSCCDIGRNAFCDARPDAVLRAGSCWRRSEIADLPSSVVRAHHAGMDRTAFMD
jgi:hypothetical protein